MPGWLRRGGLPSATVLRASTLSLTREEVRELEYRITTVQRHLDSALAALASEVRGPRGLMAARIDVVTGDLEGCTRLLAAAERKDQRKRSRQWGR